MLQRVSLPLLPRARQILSRFKTSLPLGEEADELGIPTKPTWSVDELLSRAQSPSISPDTLDKLHKLSALISPTPGSTEHAKLTGELEEMVKLVEAVKHVDVEEVREDGVVPDGRIWQDGRGLMFAKDREGTEVSSLEDEGKALLEHAQRTAGGFYVVEHERKR